MSYAYELPEGGIATCSKISSMPSGAEFMPVDVFPEDRLFRNAWMLDDTKTNIVVSINKAKVIAHTQRKAERDRLFAPHDQVISKQIPGVAMQDAEEAREKIRVWNTITKEQIDKAETVNELREILVWAK